MFCYSAHTGLRPGFINLSNGRRGCGMSAQLSLPRCGQRRSGRRIWANDASHSWELGLITPEWSNTELWAEGTGQLLIYGAQAVIAKVSQCPACLFFPPWEACPSQEQLQGRAGTCLLQCCFITASNPTTPHPKGPLQGVLSFPSPCSSPLISVHKAPRLLPARSLQPHGLAAMLR